MNRAELERLHERWQAYPGRYTPTALDMTELLGALLAEDGPSPRDLLPHDPDQCATCDWWLATRMPRTDTHENWSA